MRQHQNDWQYQPCSGIRPWLQYWVIWLKVFGWVEHCERRFDKEMEVGRRRYKRAIPLVYRRVSAVQHWSHGHVTCTVDAQHQRTYLCECNARPGEAPTYVCAKIAYLRGQKSQYCSMFIAYLRQFLEIFTIFLSAYSIFEAWIWKKKINARNLRSSTHNGCTIWLIPIFKLTICIPGDRSGEIVVWDLIRLSHFWQSHIQSLRGNMTSLYTIAYFGREK